MLIMLRKRSSVFMGIFLALETALYCGLLAGGSNFTVYAYTSIVLCFVYGLLQFKSANPWMLGGMACTVGADFFLVVCSPADQLWGMVFFMAAQSMYAVALHKKKFHKPIFVLRLSITVIAPLIALLVLRDKTDALSVISLCYYVNLIFNLITAWSQGNKVLGIGFVLFLLCDTVIGLQVAAGGYLPIGEGTLLHRIIFIDFNLAWFFYLPSQVLIALKIKERV